MEFNKCSRCGNFYISNDLVCPKCKAKDAFEFETFQSYIQENGLTIKSKNCKYRKSETRLELKKNCSTFATERRDKDYDGVKFIAIKFLRME